MLSEENLALIRDNHQHMNLERRAFAAYYQHDRFRWLHPSKSDIYVVPYISDFGRIYNRIYIKLSSQGVTLSVYRQTNKGELKWLNRWPRSVEDDSAKRFTDICALGRNSKLNCDAKPIIVNDDLQTLLDELD